MLTVIRNADVFSPVPLGSKDVLIAGGTIVSIQDPGELTLTGADCQEIEATGLKMIPGLVDPHVHI